MAVGVGYCAGDRFRAGAIYELVLGDDFYAAMSSRLNVAGEPVTTMVLPAKGLAAEGSASGLATSILGSMPTALGSATTCFPASLWKKSWTESAMAGPISLTSRSCSTVVLARASKEPK